MAKENPIAEIRDGAVYILQPGTPVYLKTADVCRMTGKSNQWIGQLNAQGTLVKDQTKHGALYEMAKTVAAYLQSIEERADQQSEEDKKIEKLRRAAEAKLKSAKARIADMDVAEREGKMHRSEDVAAMTEDLIMVIRGGLMALPGRLARDVIDANTTQEASDIIEGECRKLMEELAEYEYNPDRYRERVRERLKLSAAEPNEDDEEDA